MNHISAKDSRAPVAIVGAGPVGLSLALGLARQGVRSIVFERKKETSEYSKAPTIHLRTLEILRQWGIDRRFRDAGELVRTLRQYLVEDGDRPMLTFDFTKLSDEADEPGILLLEQGQTEKLLLEAVEESGMCDVRFGAEATGLGQDKTGARLTVREDGAERSVDVEFVVGCDGASSFVRSALDLPFEGITYSIRAMLADVLVEDFRDALPWPRIRNERGALTMAIRLKPRHWRIIRLAPGELDEEVPREELTRLVDETLGEGPVDTIWASRFRIHRRAVPRFRVGRVLLAGDAAHVHSPTGGQGMNAGMQDSHNLAWKLAYALRGGDVERLLASYDVERRSVVVGNVSRFTDLLTRSFLQTPAMVRGSAIFLLRQLLRVPRLRRISLRRTTMIDLGYSSSPLLNQQDRSAGVRLPNPTLRSGDGTDVRLYDLLPNGPVLLDVAAHRHFSDDLPVKDVIRIGPGEYIDLSKSLRGLLGGNDGWILVRPDTHVAWARHSEDGIEGEVRRSLGMTI